MGNKYVLYKLHISETHAFLFYYELDPLFLKMLYLGMYKPSIFLLTKIEHLPKNTADLYMYALYLQNKSLEI